ncbi:MAG: acyl carrier protein [Lachnospiraceae bacterium]|nr:acyl carrier protein [Lachnospiraceae bacterium]
MREEIIELFKQFYEGEEEVEFTEETSIMDDLEFSSLEFFSLMSTLEDKFDIKITERELQTIVTIGDVIDIVESKNA